ncbi:MAG: hypothetical protein ABI120_01490 [Gemmatimonadaceae bacterium]
MWYRAWLEVRWRLVLMALLNTFIGALLLDDPVSAEVWLRRLGGNLPVVFAMNAIVLAGSGVASQLSQRPGQLVHPSMMFLLSLPITRARLVLVRESVGALAALALMMLTFGAFFVLAPELRVALPVSAAAVFIACVGMVVLTAYSISALLSTFLDQLWQTYGAMALVALVLGVFPRARFWDSTLRHATDAVTVATSVSWIPVVIGVVACVCLCGATIAASVRVVQRKQF